ncbi:MAG: hypothetical protein HZT40_08445 [Candidatus Thiothrix singaporensis]|uniref:Uncharacterized protein n=1 Tax=Candidatus Thiothrix singaporensis TaxID=2799669 RepID=A0A7L6AM88_9GAMM|nr:MAG: hypothetical protein HZT40_08445 [Candidatus Thiothrix singaporensis]
MDDDDPRIPGQQVKQPHKKTAESDIEEKIGKTVDRTKDAVRRIVDQVTSMFNHNAQIVLCYL